MPEMIPVGNTGIQPDPLGSISKMISARSGMIGLQQQQQDLQTGAYRQQTAQAGAQVATQQAGQLQALAQFTKNAINDPKYLRSDGSLDTDEFSKGASMVAPTQQDKIGEAISNATGAITNRRALTSLTSEQQKLGGGYWASVAGNPNAQDMDVINAAKMTRAIDPKNQLLQDSVDNALVHFGKAQTPQQRQQIASGISSLMSGGSPLTGGTNAAGQNQVVNTLTQARSNPSLAPESPGIPAATNPSSPQVAAQQTTQTGAAGGDNDRFNQISQENQKGQSMVALSQQVSNLADQVRSGKLSKEWADRLAVLQQDSPSITSRQMLSKYAAQLKAMAESGASTDAERSTVEAGMPNPDTMDPAATKEAAQYVGGMGALRNARDKVASQYIQKNGNSSGLRAVDDQFMQHADPFVYTYKSLPPGPERQQFLLKKFGDGSKITNQGALQQFLDQQNIVKHYGG
jgi:hypothetical protein